MKAVNFTFNRVFFPPPNTSVLRKSARQALLACPFVMPVVLVRPVRARASENDLDCIVASPAAISIQTGSWSEQDRRAVTLFGRTVALTVTQPSASVARQGPVSPAKSVTSDKPDRVLHVVAAFSSALGSGELHNSNIWRASPQHDQLMDHFCKTTSEILSDPVLSSYASHVHLL